MHAFVFHLLAGPLTFVALPYFLWLSRWVISRNRRGHSIQGMLLGVVLAFAASVGVVVFVCDRIGLPMAQAWSFAGVPVAYALGLVFVGYPLSGWILGVLGRNGWLPDFELTEGSPVAGSQERKTLTEAARKQVS